MHDARVLTVRQPHAWAIVTGAKVIEQRVWSTKYRGLVLIHAGLVAESGGEHLPRGLIIGHVQLAGCVPGAEGWDWVLTEPVLLASPVPHRGALGLRRVPSHLAGLLDSIVLSPKPPVVGL
jgi:hypothetical protein